MATITEDFVSFETAKLLKEKGFNEPCDKRYFGDDCSGPSYIRERWEDGGDVTPKSNNELDDGSEFSDISAPTLQMAMKWLREEKCIAVVPILSSVLDNEKFLWDIEITVAKTNESYHQGWTYESYERACEVAIKYCLENLI